MIYFSSGSSLFTDLGPSRWVKIRTPDGEPHCVTQSPSHVSSDKATGSLEVTSADVGHSHPESKAEARRGHLSPPLGSLNRHNSRVGLHPPSLFLVRQAPHWRQHRARASAIGMHRDVNKHIYEKLKKPPEQQCLLLNGRQLQDDRTLSHYSIQSKATISNRRCLLHSFARVGQRWPHRTCTHDQLSLISCCSQFDFPHDTHIHFFTAGSLPFHLETLAIAARI